MKILNAAVLGFSFLALSSAPSFANESISDIQRAVDACNPCGSSDPCACCTTAEDKAKCEKGNSEDLVTLPADGGWQVVPRN